MQFAIVIAQTPNTYSAYAPDVPGCGVTGATVADVKQVLAEALALHLAGEPVPALTTTVDSIGGMIPIRRKTALWFNFH